MIGSSTAAQAAFADYRSRSVGHDDWLPIHVLAYVHGNQIRKPL
jgi:hypothetical protein